MRHDTYPGPGGKAATIHDGTLDLAAQRAGILHPRLPRALAVVAAAPLAHGKLVRIGEGIRRGRRRGRRRFAGPVVRAGFVRVAVHADVGAVVGLTVAVVPAVPPAPVIRRGADVVRRVLLERDGTGEAEDARLGSRDNTR